MDMKIIFNFKIYSYILKLLIDVILFYKIINIFKIKN